MQTKRCQDRQILHLLFMQLCLTPILYIHVKWIVLLESIFEKAAACQLPKCMYRVLKSDGFPFMVKSVHDS